MKSQTSDLQNIRIPQKLVGVNAIIKGVNTLGSCKEVSLPKIERQTVDVKGHIFARKVPTGTFNNLEAELSFQNYNIVPLILDSDWINEPMIIHGAVSYPKTTQVIVKFKGHVREEEMPKLASEGDVEIKIKLDLSFYCLSIGGRKIYEIDIDNLIFNKMGKNMAPYLSEIIS